VLVEARAVVSRAAGSVGDQLGKLTVQPPADGDGNPGIIRSGGLLKLVKPREQPAHIPDSRQLKAADLGRFHGQRSMLA
jgi:hypothetical protein